MEGKCVRGTSTAAEEPGEAFLTFILGVYVVAFEFIHQVGIPDSLPHIAQEESFISHELMTGIQVTPRSYRQVLGSGSASGQPLVNTGPTG